MVLILVVVLLLAELFDQLIYLNVCESFVAIIFRPVVSFYYQLEELICGFEKLKLAVVELLVVLFLQLI